MSPPLLGVGEEKGRSHFSILASSTSTESVCLNGSGLKEHNYMGLSDCSSMDSSKISSASEANNGNLNLKATELRLGLPGSQSPERDPELLLSSGELYEKPLFPLHPSEDGNYLLSQKTVVPGNKRGFSDAIDGFSEERFVANSKVDVMLSPRATPDLGLKYATTKDKMETKVHHTAQERLHAANESTENRIATANDSTGGPATKARLVGWPPVRSYRKTTLATTTKKTEEVHRKEGPGALFVKVSMDGVPYLRKVDLRTYNSYPELSAALKTIFSCFSIGQYGSRGAPGKEMISECKMKDLLNGSEYAPTYEDKDGDWMLVGDVPWEMFVNTCKRLRIMKSSEAVGLAP